MKDITLIILTKNEEKNIRKCITSAKQIADRIIVVDCGSEDKTQSIAKSLGAEVYYHAWEGQLAEEINRTIGSKASNHVAGYEMRWRVFFMGKWIKHGGTHKPYFLRLFRYGKGRVEDKLMDEHIIVDGKVEKLSGDLIHYDYKGLDAWINKHVWYSNLELQMYNTQSDLSGGNIAQKRKRGFYYRLPLFLRARIYYWYRYYGQLGFLDGKEGKIFIYLQAYWFRFLVDAKVYESEKK